jgi:pimeloyl-ACP methyl ester carboxylesterase
MGREQDDDGRASKAFRLQSEEPGRKRFAAASLLLLAIFYLSHFNTGLFFSTNAYQDASQLQQPIDFDWDTAETSSHLIYKPCYETLNCARLELPMDWFNQTTNATISLAVTRQPAAVPVTHPQYGGAIIFNPGGPGGSGVGLLLRAGEHLRWVVDTDTTQGKYFDLISFDPRGVGLSRPRVDCFHDQDFDASWQQRVQEEGWFESSNAAFGRLWSMSIAKGRVCSNSSAYDGDDIKRYVSTASVARDMLELVEKHGEWRDREARSLLDTSSSLPAGWISQYEKQAQVPAPLRYVPGTEKIQYYGFSYGTYLGGTFAAMFPDRVERLIVDGVVEYGNYLSANWSSNLVDTEKTMDSFYFHCARVGYPACALANETSENTPTEIKKRSADILKSLYHNPLPIHAPAADVLSYSEVKTLIFASLYKPVLTFPAIAFFLLAIEQKNSAILAPIVRALHPTACTATDPEYAHTFATEDAQVAIACSDGDDQSYMERDAFEAFAQELADISPSSGSLWSLVRMSCVHYKLPAVHRFKGPWIANTSHPLLFIGNTADPVTPGLYARRMAEGFEGAVALMQDSGGHCSEAAFSWCTTRYIRQYFQTGELPSANTTCSADAVPFGPAPGQTSIETVEVRAGRERWERMAEVSLRERSPGLPGGKALHELRQVYLRS